MPFQAPFYVPNPPRESDSQWLGRPAARPAIISWLTQQTMFDAPGQGVTKTWRLDHVPEPIWLGAPRGPKTIVLSANSRCFWRLWRWDLAADTVWAGTPLRASLAPQLTQPQFKMLWRFGTAQEAVWTGDASAVPLTAMTYVAPSYVVRSPFYTQRGADVTLEWWAPQNGTVRQPAAVTPPKRGAWWPGPAQETAWQWRAPNATLGPSSLGPVQKPETQVYAPRGWPDAPWVWVAPQNFATNYLYGGSPVGGEWSQDPAYEYAWQWAPPNATVRQPAPPTPPIAGGWLSTDTAQETTWRWAPGGATAFRAVQFPTLSARADLTIVAPPARRALVAPFTRRALPIKSANISIGGADMTLIWTDVYASRTVTAAGGYACKTGGITLTLAASARGGTVAIKAFAVPIVVVDASGAPFDVTLTTFVLSIINEEVTLTWSAADASWIIG